MLKCQKLFGISTLMSRINFVLSGVEHEKKFYNLGACTGTEVKDITQCGMTEKLLKAIIIMLT